MIDMWDESFTAQNEVIGQALKTADADKAFELMHDVLDGVWQQVARLVRPGGFVCINIGDATRTIDSVFRLYPNHSRIINFFLQNGFQNLPNIIWRKPTNAPNKFMGSGMLPAGAYVTLEHEYILVFRKGGKRIFKIEAEKQRRAESAFFWEERNQWFSDCWEFRGTGQKLTDGLSRDRSGAYPFELPYRLINMLSVKEDTILDPFLGTGTTLLAALTANRNSIGCEFEPGFAETIGKLVHADRIPALNRIVENRLIAHRNFVDARIEQDYEFKHINRHLQFPVITSQETQLVLEYVTQIRQSTQHEWIASYVAVAEGKPDSQPVRRKAGQLTVF
jgi:DNA modification methylase